MALLELTPYEELKISRYSLEASINIRSVC